MRSMQSTSPEHNTIGGNMRLARIVLSAALSACGTAAVAQAGYPHHAIRIVVPLAAGGNVDIVARTLAEQMAKSLGQPVPLENRPGASGPVGTPVVATTAAECANML